MQIQLRFFASVREKVGSAQESLDVPESVRTVGDVRALLREGGLKLGRPSRRDFAARVRELAADDPVLRDLVEPLLAVIAMMTGEAERLSRRVIEEVRQEPICRRLMTVPGVGETTT